MPRRRGATGLRGILLVDKPLGPTSHDVVAGIRRVTGEGRVGHAGTLDPLATGLLIVLIGPYTRLEPYLASAEKRYLAEIAFGTSTDTDDAGGVPILAEPVRPEILDPDYAQGILRSFVGPSMQVPPAYSAIKVQGRTAYRAARSGEPLELTPRPIEVRSARLMSISDSPPSWSVDFVVSKGTYIRALARDIGRAAGCPAHLCSLRRVRSGPLDVRDASPFEDLALHSPADVVERFVDPFEALGLPIVDACPADVKDGRRLQYSAPHGQLFAVRAAARLAGIYLASDGVLVPQVCFPEETTCR